MTISSETNKLQFAGSGTTGPFTITNLAIQNEDQVSVTHTDTSGSDTAYIKTTDYTINADLTELTTVANLASGETLTVVLDVPHTQATDYITTGTFDPETEEDALDKLTLIAKQHQEELDRSIKLEVSTSDTNIEIEDPTGNASKYLQLNTGETALSWVDTVASELSVLSKANGTFYVGDGTNIVAETGNTARTSLALGTGDSPTFTSVTLSSVSTATVATGDKVLIQDVSDSNNTKTVTAQSIADLGTFLNNIVEDTTPQLGGMLDINGNAIGDGTLELLTFTEDASAVNHINIENEATGSGPILSAAGDDTNIDLIIDGKGSGVVKTASSNLDITGNIVVSGTVDGRDVATDGTKLDGVEASADVTDETNVKAALDGATITTTTVATNDKVLLQDASNADNLRTVTAQSIADLGTFLNNIVEDTTPQLGGMLDVNSNAIGDGTRELITFTEDASAVNQVNIENEATGSGPIISAAGDDTNIDLVLDGKGSGVVKTNSSNLDVTGNIVVSGTVDGRDIATDGTKLDGIEASADVTDEANVTSALDGATLTAITVASGDKVILQDASDTDNIKTATAQSIANLGEATINHDNLTGFVANEHIDWTSASSNFNTSGSITGTGVVDFGGATSVEIPSGTTVTTNAAGEIALDTNGNGTSITTGVIQVYDGTQNTYVVSTTNYPTSDNDVPAYDSGTNSVTWQSQTGAGGGGEADVQTFTSSGTWNKPASGTRVFIQCWGAGGGGGRGGSNDAGGGGGGGAYSETWIAIGDAGSTETVTIGAGGAAATSDETDGGTGGNTTFGSLLTAYGGGGGEGSTSDTGGGGGGGGTAAAGSVGAAGDGGAGGATAGGVGGIGGTSAGGDSSFGGGGGGGGSNDGGGSGFGGGGGGGGATPFLGGKGDGGDSYLGGGGGGGGTSTSTLPSGSGGISVLGGNGGAGAFDANVGTSGTAPGGGGGGSEVGNAGAGGAGKCIVTTF